VRAAFPLVAIWFLVFALPLLLFTPDAPATGKGMWQAARDGLKQLRESMRQVRRYAHLVRFLIAYMVYIDGLGTLFAFGSVYAAGTFDMTEAQVLLFGIALNVTAGLGTAGFAWIDDWIGSKRTILLSLVGLIAFGTLILLVGSRTAFWALGLALGVFVGPVQAASRSYLARAAPEDVRNQMFGLYALSGKATAFFGPLLVGWVTYWAESQCIGMATIVVLFVLGLLLMLGVPPAAAASGPSPAPGARARSCSAPTIGS
jgi:UMF1 family MFS transporter